jgi:hypothetical protein
MTAILRDLFPASREHLEEARQPPINCPLQITKCEQIGGGEPLVAVVEVSSALLRALCDGRSFHQRSLTLGVELVVVSRLLTPRRCWATVHV